MTAPAALRAKTKKPRRPRALPALSFPASAPGEAACVGYGDWGTYVMLDELIGSRNVRVRFNQGIVEIMSISPLHERLKTRLGRFVEAWCDHIGQPYEMLGSATQTQKGKQAAEPDESYAFGKGSPDKPDLVIEVALSSGGMDKLDLWAGLGVPELWVWQNETLRVYQLKAGRYVSAKDSRFLRGFPFHLVPGALAVKNGSESVQEFRRRLAEKK